ncbi:MAG: hypothetical protein GX495_09650 [Chloroflexi bacterium]|jgi:hypothetical protein|nr:hypothetical protein [Chloroflexota bacterium]
MRITRDTLMNIVKDTVSRRTRADRGLMSIYLCGSLLRDDGFLLGGTTDIDLVFIHSDAATEAREIVPITREIHLDISHHHHRDYRQPRQLRVHPWMGPTIFSCTILYDPQHFMDFTQASVRGQFNDASNVMQRARSQAEHARQMWFEIDQKAEGAGIKEIAMYYKALDHAVNAIASLSSQPLTERRYLLEYQQRAEAVGQPGLYPGLLGLLGANNLDTETVRSWLSPWEAAFDAAYEVSSEARFHPARRVYYQQAFDSFIAAGQPQLLMWALQRKWVQAVCQLPEDSPVVKDWQQAFTQMGIYGDAFVERVRAFDAYLDLIEETLDRWAYENGVL